MQSIGYINFKRLKITDNIEGDYKRIAKGQPSFVHVLQIINNPAAMDDFMLAEVETVRSESEGAVNIISYSDVDISY